MKNEKVGEEYLFSNDGIKWEKGVLESFESEYWDELPASNRYHANGKAFNYCACIPEKETTERKLYTQSMHDNGEPIEVGMWFNYVGCEVECLLPADDSGYVIYRHNGDYGYIKKYNAKPFPDPDKLIDGAAYMFDMERVYLGFYRESRKAFFTCSTGGNKICSPNECTNIRELTIKDKWHV